MDEGYLFPYYKPILNSHELETRLCLLLPRLQKPDCTLEVLELLSPCRLHHQTVAKLGVPGAGGNMSKIERRQQEEVAAVDRGWFLMFFPEVVKDLVEDEPLQLELADVFVRLKEVLEYNSLGGKHSRGLMMVAAFQKLAGPEQQDEKSLRRAMVVGWCIELLQTFLLMVINLTDNLVKRRGRLCWHKKKGIGLDAVNDSYFFEMSVYQQLKRHCRDQPYYLNLLELFLQSTHQAALGHSLECKSITSSPAGLDRFSEKRYKTVVKYKKAYHSFYLPVATAMYMAGIEEEEPHEHAKAILLEMGELFQIQDDFLDCYGDPSVTGKIGTDIQDNKCSWLVVECLKRASPEQRHLLEENYGQKDPDKVSRVKQLYNQLDLKSAFEEYEEKSYQRLLALITQHAQHLPSQIFFDLLQKIYKRQK